MKYNLNHSSHSFYTVIKSHLRLILVTSVIMLSELWSYGWPCMVLFVLALGISGKG